MEYGNPNPMETICRLLRELGYGEDNQLPPENLSWFLRQPRVIEIMNEQLRRRNLLRENPEFPAEEASSLAPEADPQTEEQKRITEEEFLQTVFGPEDEPALDEAVDVEGLPTNEELSAPELDENPPADTLEDDIFQLDEFASETDQAKVEEAPPAEDDLLLAEEEPLGIEEMELAPTEQTDQPVEDDPFLVEEEPLGMEETEIPSTEETDQSVEDELFFLEEEPLVTEETEVAPTEQTDQSVEDDLLLAEEEPTAVEETPLPTDDMDLDLLLLEPESAAEDELPSETPEEPALPDSAEASGPIAVVAASWPDPLQQLQPPPFSRMVYFGAGLLGGLLLAGGAAAVVCAFL